MEQHLRFLASDALRGRMTGTPGYEAAAEYVASQFYGIGLEPAGDDDYFQPVPYAQSRLDAEESSVRVHAGEESRELAWRDEFVAFGDMTRPHTQVRAPAAFVGYGVHAPELGHDDYGDIDVSGKIVVMVMGAPEAFPANERAYHSSLRLKAETAAERGAVGMVLLRSAYRARQYPWDRRMHNVGTQPAMSWLSEEGRPAYHHPELRGSMMLAESAAPALFEGAPRSYEEIMDADQRSDPLDVFPLDVEIEIDHHSDIERVTSPNVVARLPGRDPDLAQEHIVYTAHLDHLGVGVPVDGDAIYNGAYDNAMGVSILLETARAFAAMDVRPRRSILFVAVGGEERGLLGSDFFARHPTVSGDMVANINLDMPLFLYPLRDVVAFGAEHSTLGDVVARAAAAEGWELAPDPMPDEVVFIRSDQYSFVRRGVPAIFLVSGFRSADLEVDAASLILEFLQNHYHRPSDDLSRPVHWPSARAFVRVNVRVGLEAANATAAPRWHEGNFFGERFGGRMDE